MYYLVKVKKRADPMGSETRSVCEPIQEGQFYGC